MDGRREIEERRVLSGSVKLKEVPVVDLESSKIMHNKLDRISSDLGLVVLESDRPSSQSVVPPEGRRVVNESESNVVKVVEDWLWEGSVDWVAEAAHGLSVIEHVGLCVASVVEDDGSVVFD